MAGMAGMAAKSMLMKCLHDRTRASGSQVKLTSNPASHLWNETPSSIVPYIVMPLAPLEGAEPPCAQAAHKDRSAAAAKRPRKRFMEGKPRAESTDSSAAPWRAAVRTAAGAAPEVPRGCNRHFMAG
jgi:hypothetical protein